MASKRGRKSAMTDEHKQALAQGRNESRVVRAYLEALRSQAPKRGRKRTAESVQRRIDAIDTALADADALAEVRLVQERMDLLAELETMGGGVDIAALEQEFIAAAKSYSERQGISYAA